MAENVILVNEQDLENLFLKWQKSKVEVKPDPPLKSKLNIDEALSYMNEKGYSISKSTIYKRTMEKTIPFHRFGKRKIIFDIDELDQWISDQLSGNRERINEVTNHVAEVARKKERA